METKYFVLIISALLESRADFPDTRRAELQAALDELQPPSNVTPIPTATPDATVSPVTDQATPPTPDAPVTDPTPPPSLRNTEAVQAAETAIREILTTLSPAEKQQVVNDIESLT